MKLFSKSYWKKRSKKIFSNKEGKIVWTRHLIYEQDKEYVVFKSDSNQPAFKCKFVKELGDKHIQVIGPDGVKYRVHKSYAGKNPSVTISFCGVYVAIFRSYSKYIRNNPGTLIPNWNSI
jgi:hypothetical protein